MPVVQRDMRVFVVVPCVLDKCKEFVDSASVTVSMDSGVLMWLPSGTNGPLTQTAGAYQGGDPGTCGTSQAKVTLKGNDFLLLVGFKGLICWSLDEMRWFWFIAGRLLLLPLLLLLLRVLRGL